MEITQTEQWENALFFPDGDKSKLEGKRFMWNKLTIKNSLTKQFHSLEHIPWRDTKLQTSKHKQKLFPLQPSNYPKHEN